MRRNKSVKHAKKRQSTSNTKVNIAKIEKDWKKVPAQMAALLGKQVKASKKNESKLQKAVNKLEKLVLKSEIKIEKASNHKNPAIAKKQLKVAEKNLVQYSKSLAKLNKELHEVSQAHRASADKHDMLLALSKQINNFEAEWKKTQAAANTAKAAKGKKSKMANARKAKAADQSIQPMTHEMDDVAEQDMAEVA